jgi:muramidase (phage lysozyme)
MRRQHYLIVLATLAIAALAMEYSRQHQPPPPLKLPTKPSFLVAGTQKITADEAGWRVVIAFLRTTAYAEGVWPKEGVNSYRTQTLSYRQIPLDYAYKDHPYWHDRIIPCVIQEDGKKLCSACTGAYQWHPDTYRLVRKEFKNEFWFNDGEFSPRNQDLAAIRWMNKYGMWKALYKGLTVNGGKIAVQRSSFEKTLLLGSGEWASFPRFNGDRHGALGQSAQGTDRLWVFFQKQLAELNGG